ATKQVQELRNLYQRDNVDAVLGYISSGDCLAVAPIAEELKRMLVLMDCGTPRIFEEGKYNYVFRTAAHATMDNVGLVRYMKAKNVKMDTLSAINQDYAWGQDSRADFVAAAGQVYPNVKLETDLLPKFGAGQYGTEISALVGAGSDVVYSSLWGGDLQAFGLKAAVEKAMAKNGGKKPSADELVAAMTGLEWQSPGGLIQMKLADGHQAIQPIAISRTKYDPDLKRVDLVDIQYFSAECVNPP